MSKQNKFRDRAPLKILRRLRPKSKMLNDFFVFDTETGERKRGKYGKGIYWKLQSRPENFIFGVVYGINYSKVIYTVEEFKEEFLHPRYKGKTVFAHNLAYDLDTIYGNIFKMDPEVIFNGKIISATNGNCRFADSHNIFQTSVEELGRLLGIAKPELGEAGKMFSKDIGPGEINRCYTDCRIVYDSLYQIFEDSGDIKITQASLSMTYFRRFHQPFDIEHNDNCYHFWNSYFGGRCEALQIGKTHSHSIDANSMYPWAMREAVYPNPKFIRYDLNVKPQALQRYLDAYEGCIYAKVRHKEVDIGFLPVHIQGKLCFPVGEFSGCWNFPEIRFALEHGVIEILSIDRVVYSDRMKSPFIDYVDTLFAKKLNAQRTGNFFEEYRVKIFMNSLYGKFAQRIESEEIYIEDVEKQQHVIDEYQRKKTFVKLSMFNIDRKDAILTVKSTKFSNISYSIPSFASYTTSVARVHLLKKVLELWDNKPVYMDTDSVFYEIDNHTISTGSGLGQWKRESKIITCVKGLKNYLFIDEKGNHRRKLKGVPKNAKQIRVNDFIYYNLMRPKEALRRNKTSGILTKRTKHINNVYTKRRVLKSGATKPLLVFT